MSEIKEKKCTGCKMVKALLDFSIQRNGRFGRRTKCKVCISQDNLIYRKNNSEKCKQSSRDSYNKKYNDPVHGLENKKIRNKYNRKYCKENPDIIAKSRLRNKEKAEIQAAKYRKANADTISARQAQYYQENKQAILDRCGEYRSNNKEKIAIYHAKNYQINKEAILAKNAKWYEDNPDKLLAKTAKRRAAKLQRTPAWVDLEAIRQVYSDCVEINLAAKTAGCTEKFVVDHEIPLQGKLVSGLHVHYNLQIITDSKNASKGNKFTPDPHYS